MSYYGTVAEADAFFTSEYLDRDQLWASASATNKTSALSMATKAIDGLNFVGSKNGELEFPRGEDTVVPTSIKEATYILALEILDGVDLNFSADSLAETSVVHGGARSSKSVDFVPEHLANGIPSIESWYRLKPFLRDSGAITLSRVD